MSIYRHYKWHFRGINFEWEEDWSRETLNYLKHQRHDLTNEEDFWYYVYNEPYADDLISFIEDLINLGEEWLDFDEDKDVLEYLLSFVQHLEYYAERGEYPRYPMETIIDKGGDCEDTAILMAFIARELDYDCALLGFHGSGFGGFGTWGHCDLGVAETYNGEFSGTYWTEDETQYYYTSCNGRNREIGDYDNKWGSKAKVYPDYG